jgi:hypothetical protein
VKPKDELGYDAKVAPCAANSPEQLGVLRVASRQYISASCNHGSLTCLMRDGKLEECVEGHYFHEIVQGKPVLASQEAVSPTQEKAGIRCCCEWRRRSGVEGKYAPSDTGL